MSNDMSFTPLGASTLALAATTTSQNVALSGTDLAGLAVRIDNVGNAAAVHIEFGRDNTVTATVPAGATPGSLRVGAGAIDTITVPRGTKYVAFILPSGATNQTSFLTPGSLSI